MRKIQNIYDDEKFFSQYKEMRDSKINANELIEIPTIKGMLPNLKGKKILDLGCGEGEMARFFIEKGAKKVVGIDVSQNMINEAKKHEYKNLEFKILPMEEISSIDDKFDIVFSSLAFHYVEDYYKLMKDISSKLKKNGYLIFSQEHPLVTATIKTQDLPKYIEKDGKRYYYLSDYNDVGKRLIDWNVEGVVKYHRNFETIFSALKESNLRIEELLESKASEEAIKIVAKYKNLNNRPFFLFVKAKKIK
ncbi:MAG: class I SAM-dependent methyltransferase [Clostridia bacterium]|nr:class I SAM-dependent methyltransferase [Clostridia bacterium]